MDFWTIMEKQSLNNSMKNIFSKNHDPNVLHKLDEERFNRKSEPKCTS
nr:hypothetical protein [Fredinandcohnia onubensis]